MIDNDFYQLVTTGVKHSSDNWGTGIIIYNPAMDAILMAQRTDNHQWATPGGKVELGESPYQGVLRECLEESNVTVNSMKCYDYRCHTAPNGKNWVSFMFFTDDADWSNVINQETEMEPFGWVKVDDVEKLDLFPPTKASIESAKQCGLIGVKSPDEAGYIPFVECPTSPFAAHDSCVCAYSYEEPETVFVHNEGLYWD